MVISPKIDAIILKFYGETTGPFWPPERAIVEAGYADVTFPFEAIAPPEFEMITEWKLEQVLGYLRTWSATQKFIAARGFDPVEALGEEILRLWPRADERKTVAWPLALRVGRTPSHSCC